MTSLEPGTDRYHAPVGGKGLAENKLGLWASSVIGLSSTAPLYSLAATLGYIVLAVGVQAPIILIIAFVPMLLTAFAYRELNTAVPDSGTAFTWAAKAFGPRTGWMSGWGVVVAGVIVMANQTEIAATYFWYLVGGETAGSNRALVTVTGALLIVAMTWISYRNVNVGARTQNVMLGVQYVAAVVLLICIGVAIANGSAPTAIPFDANWFNPFAITSMDGFLHAVLYTIFIYWGWDTCLSMSEETRDPRRIPGRAALVSSVALVITYVAISVGVLMVAGVGTSGIGLGNEDNADDVFFALQDSIMGGWGPLLIFAVAISALATCQTTILPTARGTFAMAVYKALPARFGAVHPRYQTPTVSTVAMGLASVVFYVVMSLGSENMLADTAEATSIAVAAYYAVTSFATIRYFRGAIFDSPRNIIFRFVFPLIGGLMMTGVLVYAFIVMSDPEYSYTQIFGVSGILVTVVVSIALGVLLMLWWARMPGSRDFFEKRSLTMSTEVKAPELD